MHDRQVIAQKKADLYSICIYTFTTNNNDVSGFGMVRLVKKLSLAKSPSNIHAIFHALSPLRGKWA